MPLSVRFRRIAGTRASLGTAGVKSIIADRPDGVAGGLGLGLSGGELQALALGAGFHNSLEFSAERLGLKITELCIDVDLEPGDILLESARISVQLSVATGEEDANRLLQDARANSTISLSMAQGFPVEIEQQKQ